MRPPLKLLLPKHRRWPRLLVALAVSIGVHVVLVLVGAIDVWFPRIPRRLHQAEAPVTPPVGDTTPLVFLPRPQPELKAPPAPEAPRREAPQPREKPRAPAIPEAPPPPVAIPADTGTPPVAEAPAPEPSPPAPTPTPAPTPGPPSVGRIGPGLGEGKLWVRPLPLPPRELAKRLKRSHADLADSAVTAIVQAYLDSIASDPSSRGVPLPDWTTKIAGKRFGVDSTAIYIAGLKIPAALLSLMPLPGTGSNFDRNRAYNQMLEYRADIEQAALRSDNLEEFKERIRAIRLRKEREEEFERSRRAPPPSEIQPAPPVPQPPPRDTAKMGKK